MTSKKVYRFIKQNHINEAHHEALQRSGVKYYDEAAETLIKQGFSDETASSEAHHEAHQNRINEAVFDAVIEMLQKELEIKNEQIKELNERLSECSAALLAAQQTAQAAQHSMPGQFSSSLQMEPPIWSRSSHRPMWCPAKRKVGLSACSVGRSSQTNRNLAKECDCMKKKFFVVIAIIVVLVILLTPVRMNLKDGGSVRYKALVYEVTKIHQTFTRSRW